MLHPRKQVSVIVSVYPAATMDVLGSVKLSHNPAAGDPIVIESTDPVYTGMVDSIYDGTEHTIAVYTADGLSDSRFFQSASGETMTLGALNGISFQWNENGVGNGGYGAVSITPYSASNSRHYMSNAIAYLGFGGALGNANWAFYNDDENTKVAINYDGTPTATLDVRGDVVVVTDDAFTLKSAETGQGFIFSGVKTGHNYSEISTHAGNIAINPFGAKVGINTGAAALSGNFTVLGDLGTWFQGSTGGILKVLPYAPGHLYHEILGDSDVVLKAVGGNVKVDGGDLLFNSGYGIDTVAGGGTKTITIGGTNGDVVNIGRAGCPVNILGNALYEYAANRYVLDKCITLNYNGAAGSAAGVGHEMDAGGVIVGYQKTNAAMTGWSFKAPNNTDYTDLVFQASVPRTVTFQDASGTVAYTSDVNNVIPTLNNTVSNLTANRVVISNGTSQVTTTSELIWNATTNALGLGVTPSAGTKFHIVDSGTTAGSGSLYFQKTGVISGIGYGIYAESLAASTINVGNVSLVRGATTNYGYVSSRYAADTASAPSTIQTANYYQVGGREYGANSYRGIGFGYLNHTISSRVAPAFIGYQETTSTGETCGDLIFGTRSSTTGTVSPTINWRLTTTGSLVVLNGTAPSSYLDTFQLYSADQAAANAAPHFKTENGDIIKIYSIGGWGTPTGTLTRTTFATYAGAAAGVAYDQTIMQNLIDAVKINSERLAALISDFKTGHQLLKA